ncbi:hypothetical protein N9M05_01550 [Candidatus Pelagibacter bacterium]|nr:hypothetical protein [Candidatus Pelagibacter bacterium]
MSAEKLIKTPNDTESPAVIVTPRVIETPVVIETPAVIETPKIVKNTRVNVDVLKQRIIEQKKKEKVKRTVFFSTVCVSLGVLTLLAS